MTFPTFQVKNTKILFFFVFLVKTLNCMIFQLFLHWNTLNDVISTYEETKFSYASALLTCVNKQLIGPHYAGRNLHVSNSQNWWQIAHHGWIKFWNLHVSNSQNWWQIIHHGMVGYNFEIYMSSIAWSQIAHHG